MKIKLVNKTQWYGPDLIRIARAALRAAGARPLRIGPSTLNHVHVTIKPPTGQRTRVVHGRAYLGSHTHPRPFKLYLPYPDALLGRADLKPIDRDQFLLEVCRVAHHEALHSVGAHHKDMTPEQRYCTQDVPWASELQLRTKSEVRPPKPVPSREERMAADQVERLEHVRAMHKKALTRAKRAATLEKKWRRRLQAAEKRNGA